jgi:hypothetical protein
MILISGAEALRGFRQWLTGRYGLDLLQECGGRVLVQLPVGVGKSRWIDAITVEAVESRAYDLVVVLCPTRRLIEERAPLRNPPAGIKVVNIRPRPFTRCGKKRDAQWKRFESADLGALGRLEICSACPRLKGCFWPKQYGKALRGAGVVYATQTHLTASPGFLARLQAWASADRVLTLLDEASFVGKSLEEAIDTVELHQFTDVLHQSQPGHGEAENHRKWLQFMETLMEASTTDLQAATWCAPPISLQWAVQIQKTGMQLYGEAFHFLGYRVAQLMYSPVESRWRAANGDLQFSVRPYLGDTMIFSGTADPKFTRHRLGKELASPFEDYRFTHPQTRWYNLASPIGSRKYFVRHAPQILDFFAGLILRRLAEGKRVLLVTKKCFRMLCADGLAKRFADRDMDLRIVMGGWSPEQLTDSRVVPLISFGMIGTNLFEEFDTAYCLSGFYVNELAVNHCLQDLTRQDLRLPIQIQTRGMPKRRQASVLDPDHRYYDIAWLVQPALEFQEHHVVTQAVGRVRPFTLPREVITFQMGQLPGVHYDAEFNTLAEARRFFGIASRREQQTAELEAQIACLRRSGNTQADVARLLGVSERAVRKYDRKENRQKSI